MSGWRIRVWGSSMFPSVRPGDVVTIEDGNTPLVPGDIVLYIREDRLWLHRVVRFECGRPVTRGDALPEADGPLAPGEVLGRVTRIERGPSGFSPRRKPPWAERVVAALCRRSDRFHRLCVFVWALRLKRGRV